MLKHRLKEPFGKAGLTVAVLALVLALVGGAYAAGGLTKAQEKQVTKIAKKYAGKPGATGPAGANGTNGTNGKEGAPGALGKDGVSVTTSAASNIECPTAGGIKVTSASGNTKVCNGQTGFTETLPSGKTETGDWSAVYEATAVNQPGSSPISFSIPLGAAPIPNFIGVEEGEGQASENTALIPSHCKGTVAHPEAVAGNLCVFQNASVNTTEWKIVPTLGARFQDPQGGSLAAAGTNGTILYVASESAGLTNANGSWAVTAE
jgi:hypothetical protein